jgi:hypothetical protein
LLANQGAILEKDYPFTGRHQSCSLPEVKPAFYLQKPGSQPVQSNKESFKGALRKSPLTVSFHVKNDIFYHYKSGILPSAYCEEFNGDVNHAMVAIGFGI